MKAQKSKTRPFFRSLITGFILIAFCLQLVSCSFPGFTKAKIEVQFDPDSEWIAEMVNLQFTLQIANKLFDEENILLEILDEVTGVSGANQLFELDHVTDHEYSTFLSVPAGSVIKYRYIKTGQMNVPEVQFNGEPVRYRLSLADNNSVIRDILYSWQGENHSLNLGVVSGIITDQATGDPIPDIIVSAGGQLSFSDANGSFVIGGLPQGEHNIVFYAMDGKYAAYQQGAKILPGVVTEANAILQLQSPVIVSFNISPPSEALGAPIHIAGNILQLGNAFSFQDGTSPVLPINMPELLIQDDGRYLLELSLYSGTDVRYKFTLGDGYWNAEQRAEGGNRVRQLIIPAEDVQLDLKIDSWKVPNYLPITFNVSMPSETTPQDNKFIQFKTDEWSQPIPLWPVGNEEYLYILFSPLAEESAVSYRFCRNADCNAATNEPDSHAYPHVLPSEANTTVNTVIDSWKYWDQGNGQSEYPVPPSPVNPGMYSTSIELTPEMDPSWLSYAFSGFEDIAEMGTRSIIFSPQSYLSPSPPYISVKPGKTPFTFELLDLLDSANSTGLSHALYPQLVSDSSTESWWLSQTTSRDWWDEWFRNYRKFILNYAEIAEQSKTDHLILGGKAIIPTFPGGFFPDGSETDVPESIAAQWDELIQDIRDQYSGKIVWATNISQRVDPLPEFLDQFDGIYVLIDSPLSSSNNAAFEEIALSFTGVIDNFVYEIYRSTQMPISVGLAYPGVDGAARGCLVKQETCYSDGLFLSSELEEEKLDLDEQALIYSAILPVIASRNWITGTVIRGYTPIVVVQDGSSSIAGKPASKIISKWFKTINNDLY